MPITCTFLSCGQLLCKHNLQFKCVQLLQQINEALVKLYCYSTTKNVSLNRLVGPKIKYEKKYIYTFVLKLLIIK